MAGRTGVGLLWLPPPSNHFGILSVDYTVHLSDRCCVMMHYQSYEERKDGSFDAEWKAVTAVLQQGVFGL